ncbi:MAG: cob(I)yrinic acid a,c-diamide adenosyltransferase [Endomicrobiales bacterium]|nr:cob(I)yrinic acid a,c-diamide adenosyltransferase [Endomicrobiales bacterium]
MLYVITGNGKGKSTSAMGQILRACGHGHSVCLVQLFKGKEFYGEQKILEKLPNVDIFTFAPKHPACFPNIPKNKLLKQCSEAIEFLKTLINKENKYKLIVLDEFVIGLRDKFIKIDVLLDILLKLASKYDVFITGRGAPRKLIEAADMVSEIKEVKHPFNRGIKAKKGIEF